MNFWYGNKSFVLRHFYEMPEGVNNIVFWFYVNSNWCRGNAHALDDDNPKSRMLLTTDGTRRNSIIYKMYMLRLFWYIYTTKATLFFHKFSLKYETFTKRSVANLYTLQRSLSHSLHRGEYINESERVRCWSVWKKNSSSRSPNILDKIVKPNSFLFRNQCSGSKFNKWWKT